MNIFDQVALEDLIVEGDVLTFNETKNLDIEDVQTSQDQNQGMENNRGNNGGNVNQAYNNKKKQTKQLLEKSSQDQELNKMIIQVLAHLEQQKVKSIQNQDFQNAAHIKNMIQGFKDIYNDIIELECQKSQALQDQDFDKCHKIKSQIIRKKQEIKFRKEQLFSNQANYMSQHSFEKVKNDLKPQYAYVNTDKKTQDIRDYFNNTPERPLVGGKKSSVSNKINLNGDQQRNSKEGLTNRSSINHDEQIVPALRNKGNKNNNNQIPTQMSLYQSNTDKKQKSPKKLQPVSPINNQKQYMSNNSNLIQNKSFKNNKNFVLKEQEVYQYESHNQRQKTQEAQYDPTNNPLLTQRFQHLKIQQIEDKSLRIKLQNHFGVLPEIFWKMILQKHWNIKKQALEYLNENYLITTKQQYMSLLEYISYSIQDTHTQVILQTLKLLNKLIQQGNNNNVIFNLPHIPYFVDDIMNTLLNYLNNTNKQILEQSAYLYLHLGLINFLPLSTIINKLIKHKNKAKVDPKTILQKLTLMVDIIEKYSQSTTKHYKEIALWAIGFLQDPNNKVKSQASSLLLILVNQVGEDKIIGLIKNVKTLEAFHAILNSSYLSQDSKLQQNLSKVHVNMMANNSLLDQNKNNSKLMAKSKQKNASFVKNQSNISGNRSLASYQQNESDLFANYKKQSNKNQNNSGANPTNLNDKSKKRSSSKDSKQQLNIQLEYSRQQSDYYSSSRLNDKKLLDLDDSLNNTDRKQYKFNKNQEQQQNQIKVYENQQNNEWNEQQDQNIDLDICDYCCQNMNGLDQRQHLIRDCKVIAYCQQCQGRIYIRQITDHLLQECNNKSEYKQCRTCGLAFNISEINQHIGRGLCRLKRGQNWERCQFCAQDILADDNKWIQHAFKCPNLPEIPITDTQNVTQKSFDN